MENPRKSMKKLKKKNNNNNSAREQDKINTSKASNTHIYK